MSRLKIITVVLLVTFLMALLCACGEKDPQMTSAVQTTTAAATTAPVTTQNPDDAIPENSLEITEDFRITFSDKSSDYMSKICKDIKEQIKKETGLTINVRQDWVKPGDPVPEFEIVVGLTEREESKTISESLAENEWKFSVGETKVYISGNTARALSDAATYFIENYIKGKDRIFVPKDTAHSDVNKFLSVSFSDVDTIQVPAGYTYPRLYKLSNGTLLLGVDGRSYRSEDDGLTWSTGSDYRFNNYVKGEDKRRYELSVANSAFIELEDGTVLVAYRATGYIAKNESVFCTRINVSQSKDGGKTWEAHSIMCHYVDDEPGFSGVWEPHFGYIDGVLTCFYANDSHSVLSEPYQHIEYLQWINGEWTNRTIVSNGEKHKSRDGMPVWQQLSNGKYVCIIEGWVPNGYALSVQLLYSDDGVNWSEPVIIYRAKNGACGAPYVLEIPETGQLLVTFQTNENMNGDTELDSPKMYMMISDGTPVEYITAESFSAPENSFNIEDGEYGLWNCAYISDKYLYIGTETNDNDNRGICIKRIALDELYKQLED